MKRGEVASASAEHRHSAVVKVALPVPVPHCFDYRWLGDAPPHDLVGRRVRVPFGHGSAIGIATRIDTLGKHERLKAIETVLDETPLFDAELWRSLAWAADYYHYPLGEVVFTALPTKLRKGISLPTLGEPALMLTAEGNAAYDAGMLRPGPGRSVLEMLRPGPLPLAALRERLGPAGRAAATRLRQRGWIDHCTLDAPAPIQPVLNGPALNRAQQAACDAIRTHFDGFRTVLIDGVTGSGKTEVYLNLIAHAIAQNRQVLVLVPEIALTPQALRRYRERLSAPVLALHSGLSDNERARAWTYARTGAPCVVLGTRSAVFTPLPKPGLIVVDEEHDGSYKQAEGFRYHARDLALVRAKTMGIPVVLGSATPSLETLARVADGRVERLVLPDRATARARPPTLRLIDLRGQRLTGGVGAAALSAIVDTLARSEQVLVFRNRRGYAPVLACTACGQWHGECPRCDHAMTVHRRLSLLICHRCGWRRPIPDRCPACSSTALDARGIGTERIESELQAHYPRHRVIRIDRDSARSTAQLDAALADVERGEPAILVGTQLLAKGHDWPHLTLVVIADADNGLYSPDFRAPERLAQLLTQVAGRAGRGERPGTVLVQTRQPEHAFWSRWMTGGYPSVATVELAERRASALPPYRHQALLAAEARTPTALAAFFNAALALPAPESKTVERVGPIPAPIPRRANHHRAQLLLECDTRAPLHTLLSAWLPQIYTLKQARRVRWSLDVDPLDLY